MLPPDPACPRPPMDPARIVRIFYANPVRKRNTWWTVHPVRVWWGDLKDVCPKPGAESVGPCWLLDAADVDKPDAPIKTFVLANVECWHPFPQAALYDPPPVPGGK